MWDREKKKKSCKGLQKLAKNTRSPCRSIRWGSFGSHGSESVSQGRLWEPGDPSLSPQEQNWEALLLRRQRPQSPITGTWYKSECVHVAWEALARPQIFPWDFWRFGLESTLLSIRWLPCPLQGSFLFCTWRLCAVHWGYWSARGGASCLLRQLVPSPCCYPYLLLSPRTRTCGPT